MTATTTVTLGFLVMVVVSGVIGIADSFAAHPDRVDIISTLNDKTAQLDSNKNREQAMRVDVITDIGPHGPAYPYSKPINR